MALATQSGVICLLYGIIILLNHIDSNIIIVLFNTELTVELHTTVDNCVELCNYVVVYLLTMRINKSAGNKFASLPLGRLGRSHSSYGQGSKTQLLCSFT